MTDSRIFRLVRAERDVKMYVADDQVESMAAVTWDDPDEWRIQLTLFSGRQYYTAEKWDNEKDTLNAMRHVGNLLGEPKAEGAIDSMLPDLEDEDF